MDLAKELGMRDSYTLFHRNMDLLDKIWATEQEKNWLSSMGLIASNIRHRDISLVEINQAVVKYALNIAKPGISISRIEQFLENPIMSGILKPSEFESMKSFGLVPEGYVPNFSCHSGHTPNEIIDDNSNSHIVVKKPKLIVPTQEEKTKGNLSESNSLALEKAILGALDYNRRLHLYKSSPNNKIS